MDDHAAMLLLRDRVPFDLLFDLALDGPLYDEPVLPMFAEADVR